MDWLDDIKVLASAGAGIGNWLLHIDIGLKVAISVVTLVYITIKLKKAIREG